VTISLGKAVLEIVTDPSGFNLEKPKADLWEIAGISKNTSLIAGAAFAAIAAAATAVAAGVVIAGKEILELGQHGAVVADVRDSFQALAESAGGTADVMLGALRKGTASTVSDFELMKMANKAMGAGLVATAGDFETLSAGAKLLADRTGGDTAEAFDALTSAMASGRTAQLKQLGLFVDNKAAVEAYARAQHISVSDMTDADRAAALQAATLKTLRGELAANGVAANDFGDRIDKLKTFFANFRDGLAEGIASSPVFAAALDAIGFSITNGFGPKQQDVIKLLTRWVENFAIAIVTTAKVVVDNVMPMVISLDMLAQAAALIESAAAAVPVVGKAFEDGAESARKQASGMREILKASGQLKGSLDVTLGAMLAAREAQDAVTTATDAGTSSFGRAGRAADELSAKQRAAADAASKSASEYRDYLSWLGEREIEDHARVQAEKAKSDAAYRAFQDEMGALELQAHADMLAKKEADEEAYRAYKDWAGQREMEAAAIMYQSVEERAAAAGFSTRAELQKTADQAVALYKAMQESGEFTAHQLQEAFERAETSKREAADQTKTYQLSALDAVLTGTQQIFAALGSKFKAAAIAGAIIATYMAIAKALAASPFPFNLVAAAGAAAAGWANVAKIRSSDEGFRTGTPGLDFADFGPGRQITAHGDEAIIPRGRGHELADEIAASLSGRGGGETVVVHVDGRNSFYQNLGDMQRLAQVVGKAVRVELGLTTRLSTA